MQTLTEKTKNDFLHKTNEYCPYCPYSHFVLHYWHGNQWSDMNAVVFAQLTFEILLHKPNMYCYICGEKKYTGQIIKVYHVYLKNTV